MFRSWLMRLTFPTGDWARPPKFFTSILLFETAGLFVTAVWLLTPIAMWMAFGQFWMLAWAAPTTIAIFLFASQRRSAGGG